MNAVRITCAEPTREKRVAVATQLRQAMGDSPSVTCGCGLKMPLRFAFRCLYCTEFYCQHCAEDHFGQTRIEYYAKPVLRIRGASI